ncbi:hypothetical protein [Leptolyngbya sp. GGD]|uniref:hypothetical protein n=1 Tax=Leptolyngbya sp. GGD TaxID=2997907 RepID=UPI00227C331A|nr:hypothetical protein [Leptolyngbya sp. GGD]MCY6494548.1 hypothetical protein [Leptolyngbya sp. GGD]
MTAPVIGEESGHSLYPRDPLGHRLCEVFNYLWHSISADNAAEPEWKTQTKYPLRPRVLWQQWSDPHTLVGVRFGATTTYALIDIDRTSRYHPSAQGLSLLLASLETIGIVRHVLVRSSDSGGLHLYLPLPYAVPTFGLAQALKQCLEAQGIEVAAGQVETFPNTKAYAIPGTFIEYNAHRLPLQPDSGSFLLDDDGNAIGTNLRQFFQYWDHAAAGQDLETLHEAIGIARRNGRKRKRFKIAPVEEWRADLQTEINEGWTGQGQTNHLLKTIACYGVVFEALKGDALAEFVQTTAMNAPGYEEYCRHQHEIARRSTVWARAAEKYWWALGTEPQRTEAAYRVEDKVIPINKNQARAEDAQRRIREAVERLAASDDLPADVTGRVQALVREAHTSPHTLYRYLDLWHPEHFACLISAECVTPPPEGNTAILEIEVSAPSNFSESSQSKKLHTLKNRMKCKAISASDVGYFSSNVVEFRQSESSFTGLPLEKLDRFLQAFDEFTNGS